MYFYENLLLAKFVLYITLTKDTKEVIEIMGKVDDNKKLKMNTLLQTAFDLFTGKGFAKTTVSDIVNQAGLAKGTFYLYFKDKYDLRDKLIAYKACQLFDDAHKQLEGTEINS